MLNFMMFLETRRNMLTHSEIEYLEIQLHFKEEEKGCVTSHQILIIFVLAFQNDEDRQIHC